MTAEDYTTPPRAVGRDAVFVRHRLKSPKVAESAYIAPNAVLCGDVTVGPHSRVLFGAVITAEGGPVEIGAHCVIMENAVVRGVPQHTARLGARGPARRRSAVGGRQCDAMRCDDRQPAPGQFRARVYSASRSAVWPRVVRNWSDRRCISRSITS